MADLHKILIKDIQLKVGRKILYGKDCIWLSEQILNKTRRQISSSTLKRFFGLIKSRFNPSKYTLDTLAVFLGFADYSDYINSYKEAIHSFSDDNAWENLRNRVSLLTENSLASMKQRTGYDTQKLIFRNFARKRFFSFINSGKTATLFVAPEGYGKTTLLIQLMEKYFSGDHIDFNNDIVALIDGGIFFNLYTRNSSIALFNQLLDFDITKSPGTFFRNNPGERKGRFWVIIDNLDEIFFNKEKYHQLAENLVRIIMANDNEWFKMVFTCRPENLEVFTYLNNKNPLLRSSWYGVDFVEYNPVRATNVPFFRKDETERILKKHGFKHDYAYLKKYHEEVIEMIRNPRLLSLFVREFEKNEDFSEFVLLDRYLSRILNSPPYQEEKRWIIDLFIQLSDRGREHNSVKKNVLLSGARYNAAYRELVSQGIIYEYIIPREMVRQNTYVKFNQNTIFEYFLFENWRAEKSLSSSLFNDLRDFYNNNFHLQRNLLRLFVRYAFHEKKFDVIKELLALYEVQAEKINIYAEMPSCMQIFILAVYEEIHSDKRYRAERFNWFFKSRIAGMLYAEIGNNGTLLPDAD